MSRFFFKYIEILLFANKLSQTKNIKKYQNIGQTERRTDRKKDRQKNENKGTKYNRKPIPLSLDSFTLIFAPPPPILIDVVLINIGLKCLILLAIYTFLLGGGGGEGKGYQEFQWKI